MCNNDGDTCTASTNTCAPKQVPEKNKLPACANDKVVDAACLCGTDERKAAKGQLCTTPEGKVSWPTCTTSEAVTSMDGTCMCSDKNSIQTYCTAGMKCHLDGDYKGVCECVPSSKVVCRSHIPAQTTCPLTCTGHTNVAADAYLIDVCREVGDLIYIMYSIKNNQLFMKYYSDSECKTIHAGDGDYRGRGPGCMPGNSYLELPDGSSTGSSTGAGGGATPSSSSPSSASSGTTPSGSSRDASGGTALQATPVIALLVVVGVVATNMFVFDYM